MKMKKTIILLIMTLSAPLFSYAQDWAQFGRYAEQNKAITERPRAIFIGDSITDSWASQDPAFFTDNNFLGRGISGQTTSHMLVRFRRDVIDHKPKYVVILAGTNDIARNNGIMSLENIFGNIVSMCELAKANKIKPIICSVLPVAAYGWRPELRPAEDVIRLNEMLKEYAAEEKISYVDYHTPLKDENNGMPKKHAHDGIHPNLQCYRIMEDIVLDFIR